MTPTPPPTPPQRRHPLLESLESRLCMSAEPMIGRYLGTDVASMNGTAMSVKFILNVTSTANNKIVGTLSSPVAGIFAFDAPLHIHSNGKFIVALEDGKGSLSGRFINGNLKFTGLVNATGAAHVVSTLDLKRNCGCST